MQLISKRWSLDRNGRGNVQWVPIYFNTALSSRRMPRSRIRCSIFGTNEIKKAKFRVSRTIFHCCRGSSTPIDVGQISRYNFLISRSYLRSQSDLGLLQRSSWCCHAGIMPSFSMMSRSSSQSSQFTSKEVPTLAFLTAAARSGRARDARAKACDEHKSLDRNSFGCIRKHNSLETKHIL